MRWTRYYSCKTVKWKSHQCQRNWFMFKQYFSSITFVLSISWKFLKWLVKHVSMTNFGISEDLRIFFTIFIHFHTQFMSHSSEFMDFTPKFTSTFSFSRAIMKMRCRHETPNVCSLYTLTRLYAFRSPKSKNSSNE